jgi:butyryl-CoA dehydrogenase
MLLAQKAICEGAFALCLYAARLVDERDHGAGSEAGDEARLLLDFLTPIVKAWPSQYCVEANSLAIQVMGGYGYTRDYPVEQYFRDNRLNPIHEGTNGIQAIDLLGRKLPAAGGAALQLVLRRASACAERAAKLTGLDTEARALGEVIDGVAAVSAELSERLRGDVESTLADAASYLDLLGLTCIAWMWLEQATIAAPRRDGADAAFYRGKLAAMRYFFRRELPRWRPLVELLQRADRTCLDAQAEWF